MRCARICASTPHRSSLDVGDQLRQGLADAPAQRVELGAEPPDAPVALLAVSRRVTGVDERVGNPGVVDEFVGTVAASAATNFSGGVQRQLHRPGAAASSRARRHGAARSAAPSCQRGR